MNLTITIPTSYSPEFGISSSSSDSVVLSPQSSESTSRHISWSPGLATEKGEFRPISPRPFGCDLVSLDVYIVHLFKATLGDDKAAANDLLRYPLFKDRVLEVLKEEKKTISRINVLCHLARNLINELEKQDVACLIKTVGVSTYISSANRKKVEALYRNLFHYSLSHPKKETIDYETDSSLDGGPPSIESPYRKVKEANIAAPSPSKKPFSYGELLEFESQANETLSPYITAYIEKRFPKLT